METSKLKKSLISFCNLAIPSYKNICEGLGNLLDFENNKIDDDICPIKFIKRNQKYLIYLFNFYGKKDIEFNFILGKFMEEFGDLEGKLFLEDFKVFAIKNYFSNPLVINKLSSMRMPILCQRSSRSLSGLIYRPGSMVMVIPASNG